MTKIEKCINRWWTTQKKHKETAIKDVDGVDQSQINWHLKLLDTDKQYCEHVAGQKEPSRSKNKVLQKTLTSLLQCVN